MNRKLIIFDFDGTLADTFSYFLNVINEAADRYRFKRIEWEIEALRHLASSQTTPEAAILIGDEIRDAQAAKDAGISFGAVTWGYSHIDSLILHGAQEIFMHAEELTQKLTPSSGAMNILNESK